MGHISQIKTGFVEHPSLELEVAQIVKVRVESLDISKGKLRLSMREVRKGHVRSEFQDVSAFLATKPDEWLVGIVHHPIHFGVFVDLPNPDGAGTVQGLVHVTE